ncbi:MAG: methyltransferase domain-containing protein [Candidatus Hydrogenedens sp.]|nr:methyltransferase domain-containing protein [Candidatus Hydrogenedens sp.]
MGVITRKEALAAAFGEAAESYDSGAGLQRVVAERLADRITALELPRTPRILEIGCGTGFLSRALRQRLGPAAWLLTDLSEAMVGRCRESFGDPADALFCVMDGERPGLAPGFDLICASLVFQWFEALGPSLHRLSDLLAPGGHLAFATLAEDTFAEWRQAHRAFDLNAGVPDYPAPAALAALLPANGSGTVEDERLPRRHADALAFLTDLKRIGAQLPTPGRRPLPAGTLRRVLRQFDRPAGLTVTYHVAYGVFRRAG